MNLANRIVSVLLTLIVAGSAFAFGPDGHRIVCHIALHELSPTDRDAVERLADLFERPDGGTEDSFEDACNFADEARSKAQDGIPGWEDFNNFETWHFFNLPRTTRVADKDLCHEDCVLEGIIQDSALLREASEEQARAEGVIFLGHWVADIHQPLHISFRDDLGGNEILLASSSKYSGHLHRVWDSGIIRAAMQEEQITDPLAYARRLRNAITSSERTQWLASAPPRWAQESYDITLQPDVQYCRFKTTPSGERCRTIGGKRRLTIDYQQKFEDDVELRLKQAGVRLAEEIRKALHQ